MQQSIHINQSSFYIFDETQSRLKKINFSENTINTSTVITIGTFDGVHIGHQKIIQQLVNASKEGNLQSCVLTFFPHPRMVLQKDANIKLINTIDERSQLLEKAGVDLLYIKTFNKEFSRMNAEDFVKQILVDVLHAKRVIIGYDHRFGRNRSADINDLRKYGEVYGFTVDEIPMQDVEDIAVSSTKIRKALLEGDLDTANSFLGQPFILTGRVTKGKQLGKTIGFPTANVYIEETYKLIPKHGAYIVRSNIGERIVYGMMNIGLNPTVNGDKESIEVHYFDFSQNLYGEKIQVEVLFRLRDEQQFDSIENLKQQLERDKVFSQQYISKNYAQ